jgi:hypothetical protein
MEPTPSTQLTQTPQTPATSAPWFIILWLVIFPPVAWYLMWKESHYHRWFAYLLWLNSFPTISALLLIFIVYPRILALLNYIPSDQLIALALIVIFGILQLTLGFIVFRKTASQMPLTKTMLLVTIITLSIWYLIFIISYPLTVLSAYNLNSSLQ